jgi:hypothetical protein
MKYERTWKWEEKEIPEDLQFLQDFYDGWIAEQIKEAKKMGIRKACEGYEL